MMIRSSIPFLCLQILLVPSFAFQVQSTSTWTPASLIQPSSAIDPKEIGFNEIFFSPDGHGWASFTTGKGAEFNIARSQDGGVTWQIPPSPQLPEYGWIDSIYFLDGKRGWASTHLKQYVEGSSGAIMLHTTDGGISWKKWSALEALNVRGLWGIHFEMDGSGFAAGLVMPGQYGVVLRTGDFGKTWRIERTIDSPDYFRGTAINGNTNWALSHHKIMLGENGRDWKTKFDRSELFLGMSIDAPTERSVIAVTDYGKVVLSENKGRTWKVIPMPDPYHGSLQSVKFADPRHGWVAGVAQIALGVNRGVILATKDGGTTWEFEAQVDSNYLFRFAVCGSKVFVTGKGAIYWRNKP